MHALLEKLQPDVFDDCYYCRTGTYKQNSLMQSYTDGTYTHTLLSVAYVHTLLYEVYEDLIPALHCISLHSSHSILHESIRKASLLVQSRNTVYTAQVGGLTFLSKACIQP